AEGRAVLDDRASPSGASEQIQEPTGLGRDRHVDVFRESVEAAGIGGRIRHARGAFGGRQVAYQLAQGGGGGGGVGEEVLPKDCEGRFRQGVHAGSFLRRDWQSRWLFRRSCFSDTHKIRINIRVRNSRSEKPMPKPAPPATAPRKSPVQRRSSQM